MTSLRTAGLFVVALLLVAVFLGSVPAAPAQATVAYSAEELAFVQLINDYRVSNGREALLISDMITEACDRHNSDMANYNFFGHRTGFNGSTDLPGVHSDWFAEGAYPWDRMALSGYNFNTDKGENIAGGIPYASAEAVFAGWKGSPGHNAAMLDTGFQVIGVSRAQVSGSTYEYYWTTDFGGYVDETAHTAAGDPPPPALTRYEQTDSRLGYVGAWVTSWSNAASRGSFRYANSSGSSVTIAFNGTHLAWIARKSPAYGIAQVSLDGKVVGEVDLYATYSQYRQQVWDTGTLEPGDHTIKIEWTGRKRTAATAHNISIDAVDIVGTLTKAPVLARYQQTDSRLGYLGAWTTAWLSACSGGSYRYANSFGATVTVKFNGTSLAWIARKGPNYGMAKVTLDGADMGEVDLYNPTSVNQQRVWSTGTLPAGDHTVIIQWAGDKRPVSTGCNISVDAFEVFGTILQAPVPTRVQQTSTKLAYSGPWTNAWTSVASGGSLCYTRTVGGTVTLEFSGTYLAWIGKKSYLYGIAEVTLDGGAPVSVDLYSRTTLNQQILWNTGLLPDGVHTVTISWTGTKYPSAAGTYISIDAFDVLGVLR